MELDYRARFHEEANPEKLLSDDGRTKTIPWEGHSKGRGGGGEAKRDAAGFSGVMMPC